MGTASLSPLTNHQACFSNNKQNVKLKMISFSWLVQYLTGNFVVVINLYWCDDDMPVTVWRVSLSSPANVLHHPRSELARPACNLIMILYIVIVPLNISVLSRRLCLDPDINRETKWQGAFPTPNTRTRLVFQPVVHYKQCKAASCLVCCYPSEGRPCHFSHFHNQLIDYQADSDGEKDKPFRMHLIALMGLTGECFSTAH